MSVDSNVGVTGAQRKHVSARRQGCGGRHPDREAPGLPPRKLIGVKLRSRILAFRWGIWATLVVVAIVGAEVTGTSVYWLLPLVVAFTWVSSSGATRLVAKAEWRRLARLLEQERWDDARRVLEDLRPLYVGSMSAREVIRYQEATVLSLEGRHAEACALLASIDLRQLSSGTLPWVLNNLAWTLALTGQGERAVAVARESMEASAKAGDRAVSMEDLRACQLGTLGAALVTAGQPDEAVAPLEQALARGGKPRQQAARAFYLGEALHALGRPDEAAAAWKRAVSDAPATELGRRAHERLEGASAYR
jgi:tetratricopeptide (TPR) repeat protein